LKQIACDLPIQPVCYFPVKIGIRGSICLRFGCSPICSTCKFAKPKNTPACYAALPGYPDECVSPYYTPQCKKFCLYATAEND